MTLNLAKTAQFHTLSTCQAWSCKLGCHTKVSFGEVSATTSGTGAFIFKAMHCQTGEPSAIISIPNCTVSEATAKAPVGNLLPKSFPAFHQSIRNPSIFGPPKKKNMLSKTIGMPNKSLHRRQPIIQKKSRPQIRHSERKFSRGRLHWWWNIQFWPPGVGHHNLTATWQVQGHERSQGQLHCHIVAFWNWNLEQDADIIPYTTAYQPSYPNVIHIQNGSNIVIHIFLSIHEHH